MARIGRPAKARGILSKLKRITHRRKVTDFDKGIVIGQYLAAKQLGVPFNSAEAARGMDHPGHRATVSTTIKDYLAGKLMPPTQPAAVGSCASPKVKHVDLRQKCVSKNACMRTKAEDGTPRPVYATQKEIRDSLPAKFKPISTTTIGRDLRATGIYLRSTVPTPCLGPEWREKRTAYCKSTPKDFPAAKYADKMIACDESKLDINNGHSCKKEYRTKTMRPMQRKQVKFPPSVMIWTAVSKMGRTIHVHTPEDEVDDDDDDALVYKTKADLVKALGIKYKKISATKRYSMAELEGLTHAAQKEWMDLERRFHAQQKGKGVNRFAHCHQCLEKLHASLQGKDHVILEDNAKIHTSCYTRMYRKHLGLKFIPGHPADSADLNPCEHVFSWLKRVVAFSGPPTKAALIKAIEREFKKIPQRNIDAWIDSYWTRMEACKKQKGDWVGERECRRPVKREREE